MPETRYDRTETWEDGVRINVEEMPHEVSDEELAMEKAEDMIDSISNLADARVFLKKLVKRLMKNGALP